MTPTEARLRWDALVASWGRAAESLQVVADLLARHAEPWRHYHTLDHVGAVLTCAESFGADLTPLQLRTVGLAVWFHDAVYDPRSADNEARSAALARETLVSLRLAPEVGAEVARLILLTRTHQADPGDHAGQVLLDADLVILGAGPAVYDAYARAIRREYAHVPDSDFRAGRARVLTTFLARPRLFQTVRAAHLETLARANLQRELASVAG